MCIEGTWVALGVRFGLISCCDSWGSSFPAVVVIGTSISISNSVVKGRTALSSTEAPTIWNVSTSDTTAPVLKAPGYRASWELASYVALGLGISARMPAASWETTCSPTSLEGGRWGVTGWGQWLTSGFPVTVTDCMQGRSDGGISVYIPPKISLPYKFLCGYWLFFYHWTRTNSISCQCAP